MNTTEQILSLLIAERDRLERAIQILQGPVAHRGRPSTNALPGGIAASRGSHARSAAQRKAQSAKMKVYWAKRRKEAAKT